LKFFKNLTENKIDQYKHEWMCIPQKKGKENVAKTNMT